VIWEEDESQKEDKAVTGYYRQCFLGGSYENDE
jgi:hypothetical protein